MSEGAEVPVVVAADARKISDKGMTDDERRRYTDTILNKPVESPSDAVADSTPATLPDETSVMTPTELDRYTTEMIKKGEEDDRSKRLDSALSTLEQLKKEQNKSVTPTTTEPQESLADYNKRRDAQNKKPAVGAFQFAGRFLQAVFKFLLGFGKPPRPPYPYNSHA